MNKQISGRSAAAAAIAVTALLGLAGCSSADADEAGKKAAAAAGSSSGPIDRGGLGKGGPCRDAMQHITDAGQKLTAEAADRAKATATLASFAQQFAADSDRIRNPEAKQAAKQLGEVYGRLAESAKTNQSPDLKALPAQVQSAIAALSACAATE
ncbi:hypothetical protein [Kitasatospora sp. NPDC002040]|uniref:hypothetical protein n=1 Tax=Kitasatospora sp. NPDC002040 TaxID=3154661 RepID=UPI003321A972